MRALIKTNTLDSFIVTVDTVRFEKLADKGRIKISNHLNGFIHIWTPIEELESIQTEFLRNGYFDFREYKTELENYSG